MNLISYEKNMQLTVYFAGANLGFMIENVIRVKLVEMAKRKEKTLFAVSRETGISYNTLFNIKKGDVKSISFDVLEKLCESLDCTPNDLLAIEK